MMLFYFLGMENTSENKEFKKTRGQFWENILTKWAGFICWGTCFIRQADEASPPAYEASPPTDKASPIGPCIFSLNRPTGPLWSSSCDVCLSVSLSVYLSPSHAIFFLSQKG